MSRRKKIKTADAFSNPAARLGFGTLALSQATDYPLTRLSDNYQLLTSMYRDNFIVQNIVQLVPIDVVRKWYYVESAIDADYINALTRLERKTQLRDRIMEGMSWGRLYGGAVGLILIKGQEDLSQPLDINAILPGSFLGLRILDRWSGVFPDGKLVTDPADPDFGLPETYTIRDANDTYEVNVHHSRLVRFIGRKLPWLEQVAAQYWGESELEAVYSEIVRRDNMAAQMLELVYHANIEYREVEGLDQLMGLGNQQMQKRFWNIMQAQAIMKSSQGISLINKGDAVHQHQYTFAGLSDVYDRVMMDVAGAARIPVTKLFGRSPAGMNSTGESDMRNYYDYIDGVRETQLRPVLEKLLPIMAMSAWGQIPDDMDIAFEPMQDANELEAADIATKKTQAIVAAYTNDLIDQETAAKELKDIEGIFDKITDEQAEAGRGVTFSSQRALNDPLAGLMRGGAEYADETDET